ncbi:MAG: YggS family pyridoxal phosphate-dependent enzyme [Planctomycetota bacterium]
MTEASELRARYQHVLDRIAAAAKKAGTDADRVILVAVSKYAAQDQIRALMEMGHRDFGESRVQQLTQRAGVVEEYLNRIRVLPNVRAGRRAGQLLGAGGRAATGAPPNASPAQGSPEEPAPVRWHMIGTLQRNKARKAVELCRLIHTVDSLRLAEELQSIGMKRDLDIECLLQVNCSEEPQKAGCPIPAARHLAEQIDQMGHLHLRGLMTMAAADGGESETRKTFERCRELFVDIGREGVGDGRFNILSMGMTGDFEIAIEEGANIVRIGSAIFGERDTSETDEND